MVNHGAVKSSKFEPLNRTNAKKQPVERILCPELESNIGKGMSRLNRQDFDVQVSKNIWNAHKLDRQAKFSKTVFDGQFP